MRAVIQRVSSAQVDVAGECVGRVERGLLILLGIHHDDGPEQVQWLAGKIARLRIFPGDGDGVGDLSIDQIGGGALVVSQFTLYGNARKGNRPSYIDAARPEHAIPLYEGFCEELGAQIAGPVERGMFGADMRVQLVNDGPVTILLETP